MRDYLVPRNDARFYILQNMHFAFAAQRFGSRSVLPKLRGATDAQFIFCRLAHKGSKPILIRRRISLDFISYLYLVKLLIIEDEALLLESMVMYLSKEGFVCEAAPDFFFCG